MAHIGDLASRSSQIRNLALELCLKLEQVWRLGFAVSLKHPVPSSPEGMDWLNSSGFLPSVKIDRTTVDFLYRVNRQAELKQSAGKILVHRLRTFSLVSVPGGSTTGGIGVPHACQLDIDVNTAQKHIVEMATHDYGAIFDAFVRWALDIATRGDVP